MFEQRLVRVDFLALSGASMDCLDLSLAIAMPDQSSDLIAGKEALTSLLLIWKRHNDRFAADFVSDEQVACRTEIFEFSASGTRR